MKTDEADLLEQISNLESINLNLQSEISFLKGKIEVYEQFLKRQGFIKEEE